LRCFVIEQEAITIPAAKAIPRAEATPAAMTGIVTRPDQPFLIPGAVGGALHQSRNRFVEMRNGGQENRSCWALASLRQIDVLGQISVNWSTTDDVRGDVARTITQGSEQELLERPQGLLHEMESNSAARSWSSALTTTDPSNKAVPS
jgi:hypothetical protein